MRSPCPAAAALALVLSFLPAPALAADGRGPLDHLDEEEWDEEEEEWEEDEAPAPAPPAALAAPAAVAAPAVAPARRNATSDVHLPERTLNDHVFIPPVGLVTPFITSYVGATTSFGIADLEFTDEETRASLEEAEALFGADFSELPLFVLSQGLEVQVGIADRVALRGAVVGSALMPRDEDTAWLVAVDGFWGLGAGASVQAVKTESFALAGSFDYTATTNVLASPVGTIAGLLETGVLDEETLFTLESEDAFSFGAQAAYAPHPLVGFLAEGSYDLERFEEEDDDGGTEDRQDAYLRLGVGVSVDLADVGAPVGLVASWVERLPVNDANETELDRTFGAGVFYTGRRYLVLGVEGQAATFETETEKTTVLGASLRIRAYF